jgi:hypothetical protein
MRPRLKKNASSAPTRPPILLKPGAVVGWVILSLLFATGPLPIAVPDQPFMTSFSAGGLGALVVLAGMYLADLARSRALRAEGFPIERIELGAFGARVIGGGTPESPAGLRRFGRAGPLQLFAVAAVAGVAAALGLLASGSAAQLLTVSAAWAAGLLALFALADLLPRPGSSGGYLVQARHWRRSGSRTQGQLSAANAGVRSGWGVGLLAIAGSAFVSPVLIWLIPVAVIVVVTSRAAVRALRLRLQVGDVPVAQVMSAALPSILAWTPVSTALTNPAVVAAAPAGGMAGFTLFAGRPNPGQGTSILVQDVDGDWSGVAAVAALNAVAGDDRDNVRVRAVAVPRALVATVSSTDTLGVALDRLAAAPAAGLVVVTSPDEVRPAVVGTLTVADINRALGSPGPQTTHPVAPGSSAPGTPPQGGADSSNPWAYVGPLGR